MMIVERLINRLMQTENNTGKKQLAIRIVRDAFEIINKKTKRNPIEVLVEAIGNSGPREETVRLKYGGINVPKSVDTAPMRRVDTAICFLAEATLKGSSSSKKSASAVLADELIAASKGRHEVLLGREKGRTRAYCKIRPLIHLFLRLFSWSAAKNLLSA